MGLHGAGAATAPDARPISRTHRNNHRNNCNNHRDPHHRAADEHRAAGELHAGIHRRRGSDAAPPPHGTLDSPTGAPAPMHRQSGAGEPPLPQDLTVRRHASTTLDDGTPGYMPLSRTTDRVIRILLEGDLSRLRAESVAESLGISCTTLRRRLRCDHTNYQFLLDRARQYRCESRLRDRWLPGKCLADELGYLEVNSFYRAFRRWTGLSYSAYRQSLL